MYKKAKAGDLICCNFTNMLEVLYLARRSSPAYGLPTKDGKVVIVSLPRMMAACVWNPQAVIQGRKVEFPNATQQCVMPACRRVWARLCVGVCVRIVQLPR